MVRFGNEKALVIGLLTYYDMLQLEPRLFLSWQLYVHTFDQLFLAWLFKTEQLFTGMLTSLFQLPHLVESIHLRHLAS